MSLRKKAKAAAAPFNAADVANIATANPYIQRLIEDADLRDSVRTALDSARTTCVPPSTRSATPPWRCRRRLSGCAAASG